jgi:hypothetical protein
VGLLQTSGICGQLRSTVWGKAIAVELLVASLPLLLAPSHGGQPRFEPVEQTHQRIDAGDDAALLRERGDTANPSSFMVAGLERATFGFCRLLIRAICRPDSDRLLW